MSPQLYADIIIPGALGNSFTYSIGDNSPDKLVAGSRVIVSFGSANRLIGVVERIHSKRPDYPRIKTIEGIPDLVPSISKLQLEFWQWISNYYMCTNGEVMDAALPSGLKLQKMGESSNMAAELRYKPRLKPYIALAGDFDEEGLNSLLNSYEKKSPAKYRLLSYILSRLYPVDRDDVKLIARSDIIKYSGVSEATLTAMIKQNVIRIDNLEVERLEDKNIQICDPLPLSKEQKQALDLCRQHFETRETVLLKGVTSSGKTELYIHLIEEQLKLGKQVLYLLPEIALTTQIITRLRKYFGDEIGVYHSRFSDNERVEIWRRISGDFGEKPYKLILGVRSSLFLPFDKLGMIIVDEEHDSSYKQKDPAPRYNARDSALVLAKLHGAKVLLGSATPSLESVFNCKTGRFGLVELNTRFGDVKMPEIEIADTKEAYRRKVMISHFTPQLISSTEDTLARGEQVVYFRNRRGYAPVLVCNECGWTPVCTDCSVNMTYHKGINILKCHYCGKSSETISKCGNCGSTDIKMKGFGTEKIEDELAMIFPEARVERMDLDTTRKKGALDRLIGKLEKGKIDILVGTQMISKGLDFENLTLVGILNVDNMLYFPDFRAAERCFQMIEQVSGRAGRREKQGKVIIQTFDPSNSIIRQAINHDFWSMYKMQIDERREFAYPPFTRLIVLYIKHKERATLIEASKMFAIALRSYLTTDILGPEFPVISRIQSYYSMTILIKIDRNRSDIKKLKSLIFHSIDYIHGKYKKSQLRIYADVDPV